MADQETNDTPDYGGGGEGLPGMIVDVFVGDVADVFGCFADPLLHFAQAVWDIGFRIGFVCGFHSCLHFVFHRLESYSPWHRGHMSRNPHCGGVKLSRDN